MGLSDIKSENVDSELQNLKEKIEKKVDEYEVFKSVSKKKRYTDRDVMIKFQQDNYKEAAKNSFRVKKIQDEINQMKEKMDISIQLLEKINNNQTSKMNIEINKQKENPFKLKNPDRRRIIKFGGKLKINQSKKSSKDLVSEEQNTKTKKEIVDLLSRKRVKNTNYKSDQSETNNDFKSVKEGSVLKNFKKKKIFEDDDDSLFNESGKANKKNHAEGDIQNEEEKNNAKNKVRFFYLSQKY